MEWYLCCDLEEGAPPKPWLLRRPGNAVEHGKRSVRVGRLEWQKPLQVQLAELEHLPHELVLAGEVAVQGHLPDPRLERELVDAGLAEALCVTGRAELA